MIRRQGSERRLAATGALVVVIGLLGGCADDSATIDAPRDDATPATTSSPASASPTPTGSAAPDEETATPATPGECSPPTEEVTYATGTATLTIASGEYAGTHQLSTEPEKTQDSVYLVGEQFIGNWRGTLEEQLPALELRMLDRGDVCNGPAIVRIYLPFLAYEDNDSMRCGAKLETLTATAVAGGFACGGIPRTFGTKEPAALDATGTFSLTASGP